MKISVILIVFGLIQECCSSNLSIQGTWTIEEDEHYVVKITQDDFFEIYDKDTSVCKYSSRSKTCDEKYLKETNSSLDFISVEDGRCFEITGITDSTLAYRYTASGRMQISYKSR